MSKGYLIFCVFPVLAVVVAVCFLWPRIFFMRDSLPGPENEPGLPKVTIEKGGVVYCRMRADDFRFPLPRGASVRRAVLDSGCFDSVDGKVEVELNGDAEVTARQYTSWIEGRLPTGGGVSAESIPGGLMIRFSYFGDR